MTVKFIRANRILPWIANNFQVKGIFFIIRHPCATIASQLETGVTGYDMPESIPLAKKIVLSSISEIKELRDNKELMRKIKTIKAREEILAVIWGVDNYLPLYYHRKFDWYLLCYESLVANLEKELKNIFSYINEEVPKEAYSKNSNTEHDVANPFL